MARAKSIPGVADDTPIGAFAARVIEIRAQEMQAQVADPSPNGSADHVHDRRVAIRRLRTAMEVFESALPKRAKSVRRELKGVFSALGPRRDADVALEALHALEPRLTAADRPGWKGLVEEFEGERAAASPSLETEVALAAGSEAALLAERARERGGLPAGKALRRVVGRRVGVVRGKLDALEDPTDAEALHELRIAAKRLRYVLEAAESALGTPAAEGAKVARDLQTLLGEVHDCDVLLPRVRAHRRALRAVDVAALRAGRKAPNAARYRGVQTVDAHVRARRDDLRAQAGAAHAEMVADLERVADALGVAK